MPRVTGICAMPASSCTEIKNSNDSSNYNNNNNNVDNDDDDNNNNNNCMERCNSRFLHSPHCAVNCLQHTHLNSQRANAYKSCATQITCNTLGVYHVPRGTKGKLH